VYSPKSLELDTVQVHVDSLEAQNQRAKAELAKGNASKLREQAEVYQRNLELMRQLVPASNEVAPLLESVSTTARRSGLELAEVNPTPVIPGDQFDTYRYTVQMIGGYHRLGEVLAGIGSLPRIVAPVNVKLEPAPEQARKTGLRANEAPLIVTFELQTYVAKGPPPGKAGT
jgi:type IV pilus assembly protein PilO